MNHRRSQHKAHALLITVAGLMLVSLIGMTFARLASVELNVARNYSYDTEVRLISQSGIDYAVARLRQDYKNELVDVSRDWIYQFNERDVDDVNYVEDGIGAGQMATEFARYEEDPLLYRRPSYQHREGDNDYIVIGGKKHNVSGFLNKTNKAFALKINDVSSQINVNSQIDAKNPGADHVNHMSALLFNLSQTIAKRALWQDIFPGDTNGPLLNSTVCDSIIARRKQLGGFTSKSQLLQTMAEFGVDKIRQQHIADYITVYPTPREMSDNLYKNVMPVVAGDETQFEVDYRAPININVASWQVLMAVIMGLQATVDGQDFSITADEAQILTNNICKRRQQANFSSWSDFSAFLEQQKQSGGAFGPDSPEAPYDNAIFIGHGRLKRPHEKDIKTGIIMANFCPNVVMRENNPDIVTFQQINKIDLKQYTVEFTFFSHGVFEIYSTGQIVDEEGDVQVKRGQYSIVRVFDVERYAHQDALEVNHAPIDFDDRKDDRDFSHPKNLQKSPTASGEADTNFGYIGPVTFGKNSGDGSALFGGSTTVFGNLRFKALFNGDIKAIYGTSGGGSVIRGQMPSYGATEEPEVDMDAIENAPKRDVNGELIPYTFTDDDLVADGVLWKTYSAYRHLSSPPMSTAPPDQLPYATVPADQGTLMLWLKILRWPEITTSWRTIFLSTSPVDEFTTDDPVRFSPSPTDPLLWVAPNNTRIPIVQPPVSGQGQGGYDLAYFDPQLQFPGDAMVRWAAAVQMRVDIRYNEAQQKLEVRVYRQLLKWPLGYDQLLPNLLGINIDFLNSVSGVTLEQANGFPVRPHEWYHIAVRWKEFTKVQNSSAAADNSIVVTGRFYDDNNNVLHRGSVFPENFPTVWDEDPDLEAGRPPADQTPSEVVDFPTFRSQKESTVPLYPDEIEDSVINTEVDTIYHLIDPLNLQHSDGSLYSDEDLNNLARDIYVSGIYMNEELLLPFYALAFRDVKPLWEKMMYVGSDYENVGTDRQVIATFDDIGVSDDISVFGGNFAPSRYPLPNDPDTSRKISAFKGRFTIPAKKRVQLSYLYWSLLETNDVTCYPRDIVDWPHNLPQRVWEELWARMTEKANRPFSLTTTTLDFVTNAVIEVEDIGGGVFRKHIAIEIGSQNFYLEERQKATPEQTAYELEIVGQPLHSVLTDWFNDYAVREGLDSNPLRLIIGRNHGAAITNADGSPIELTASPIDYDYEGNFVVTQDYLEQFAPGDPLGPLFDTAVIQEVFMSYQSRNQCLESYFFD